MGYFRGHNPCIGGTRNFTLEVSVNGTTAANSPVYPDGYYQNRSATTTYEGAFTGSFDWTAKDCSCQKNYTGSRNFTFNQTYNWSVTQTGSSCPGTFTGTWMNVISLNISAHYESGEFVGFKVSFGEYNLVAGRFACPGSESGHSGIYSMGGLACCWDVPCPGYSVIIPPDGGSADLEISCSRDMDLGASTISGSGTVTVNLTWL